MRDIKFRAWDTITNKMHNPIEELCFEKGILIEVIFKISGDRIGSCADEIVDWQNADQTILMQYTGLNDKNGVEIYEDDIVKFNSYLHRLDQIGVIKWDKCGYNIENGNEQFMVTISIIRMLFFDSETQLEVIGNVHDNPELLESRT